MPGNLSTAAPPSLSRLRERGWERIYQAGHLLAFAARRFYADNCFQTAASLTYTTLLAIVPLMTIGFAIFTAFPAFGALQNELQAMIFKNLVPEIGDALSDYLTSFMSNAGRMPVFGVLGLAVTAILLIWTIEGAFSSIWRVREPRALVTRVLSFWAIVSLGPLFAGVSLTLSSSVWTALQGERFQSFAMPILGFASLVPLLVQMMGCSLLYLIIPNRTVEVRDAVAGGVVGSLLLEASKIGFAWYMREFPAYQTIYGALATVPIFLFWLYVAWSTLLFGAVVTASMPEWRSGRAAGGGVGWDALAPGERLVLALSILQTLSASAKHGRGMRRREVAAAVSFGVVMVEGMLERLSRRGWVAQTTRETWVVPRDLAESTLLELMNDLELGVQGPLRGEWRIDADWAGRLKGVLDGADAGLTKTLSVSLKQLFRGEGTCWRDAAE